jgi:hypothetical protein
VTVDVYAFVEAQADLLAAKLTAFALTNPQLQTAAGAFATFKEEWGPAFSAASLALWAYGPELGLDTGDRVTDGSIEDAQNALAELPGVIAGDEIDSASQESPELNLAPAANDNIPPTGAAANDNLGPIVPAPLPEIVPAASPPPVAANDNAPAPETPPAPDSGPAAPSANDDTQV